MKSTIRDNNLVFGDNDLFIDVSRESGYMYSRAYFETKSKAVAYEQSKDDIFKGTSPFIEIFLVE